jgi:hypothetical protein
MNPTRTALSLVEPYLAKGYWAKVMTMVDRVYFETGFVHSNGFEECPTYSGIVLPDGKVVESHRRI